jgi:Leucine-rich repeat (LRR) protein
MQQCNFRFYIKRGWRKFLISALVILLAAPSYLMAQEEVTPVYIRPDHKVFKSLSAALQQPDSVFILELKGKKLKEIPEGVFKLPYLKVLDLSRNKIKEIPVAILQLDSLEELDLSNNKLSSLPHDIGSMIHLKKLALNRNTIEELPVSIGSMQSLEVLELWDNEIGTLPDEMKQLLNLKTLELRGILFSEEDQKHFHELLPNTRIYMSPSCNCKTQ